ncbi:MAG: 4-alpha-glucanotransferase [Blastocatellia bacterium]|jgi:4-alpha-glucanotransferase|nr:4-alpha-glucanotransferase [Blastocatellia bacterium]
MHEMILSRASGILLHPTSLPGPFGIGDLGDEAYRFVDFLSTAGQSLWQMLPLGPTGGGASPYSSISAFAGNPLLISPQKLAASGLLPEIGSLNTAPLAMERVDFDAVRRSKGETLRTAFAAFEQTRNDALRDSFQRFCLTEKEWLDNYALFQALQDANGGLPWTEWPAPLRMREPNALTLAGDLYRREVLAQKFYQFLFFQQWRELKQYCQELHIKLIGDMPIFVAHDSADVWANPEWFKLDEAGLPLVVAGVPPDYFSASGQFWGNPIYDWDAMAGDGFRWWIARLRALLETFDLLRIDHFRGFEACWEIPASDTTAERGTWVHAPGRELFATVEQTLGTLPIIAEDLGVITPAVDELRDALGFPGMRVMQFGFSGDRENLHLPRNYPPNVVAYTATHDNNTTVGWFRDLECPAPDDQRTADERKREREFCLEYLKSDGTEINWDFIGAVLGSKANTAIIPLQDVLGRGTAARMNLPNTVAGNWEWRFQRADLRNELAARLRELTELSSRSRESSSFYD